MGSSGPLGPVDRRVNAGMAGWDDVRRIALALPETSERTSTATRRGECATSCSCGSGRYAERTCSRSATARRPARSSAARVEHLGAKDALLADDPGVYFTTPHFDGYRAILVRLDEIGIDELEEVIVEAWLVQAPKRLARE